MIATEEQVSTFAKIVDKLRDKSEEELKLLYIKFFRDDLVEKWEKLTCEMNFGDGTDEDIVNAIQKKRYPQEKMSFKVVIDANVWVRFARS